MNPEILAKKIFAYCCGLVAGFSLTAGSVYATTETDSSCKSALLTFYKGLPADYIERISRPGGAGESETTVAGHRVRVTPVEWNTLNVVVRRSGKKPVKLRCPVPVRWRASIPVMQKLEPVGGSLMKVEETKSRGWGFKPYEKYIMESGVLWAAPDNPVMVPLWFSLGQQGFDESVWEKVKNKLNFPPEVVLERELIQGGPEQLIRFSVSKENRKYPKFWINLEGDQTADWSGVLRYNHGTGLASWIEEIPFGLNLLSYPATLTGKKQGRSVEKTSLRLHVRGLLNDASETPVWIWLEVNTGEGLEMRLYRFGKVSHGDTEDLSFERIR